MNVLKEFGNLHNEAEMAEADDRSSSGTSPINNEFCAGFDIIINMLRTTKTVPTIGKLGKNGIENRKMVDAPWVITIVFTVPNLLEIVGTKRFARPMAILLTPWRIGADTS